MPSGLSIKSKIADKLVFRKILDRLGGRVRFVFSGGAPLSEDCMTRRVAREALASVAATLALTRGAVAGQVFVLVNSDFYQDTRSLTSTTTTLNAGDVVIWRWVQSGHTVTSGTTGSPAGDGKFNSDPSGTTTHNLGTFFSWKTTSGTVPYYCRPHFALNMKGTINVGVPAASVTDFRITEVRFDGVGSNFIEITNLGNAVGDLAAFRLVINGTATTLTSQVLNPGERVTFPNPSGLAPSGSAALYAPETIASNSDPGPSLSDATMMIDYVEWGAAGNQPLESVAAATTSPVLWTASEFAPQAAAGHSIVFCGVRFQHGAGFWNETKFPTPAAVNDCVNPTLPSTWGRIKTLYR